MASAGDSIVFSSNVDSVVLTTGQIVINKNLTISGHSKDRKVSIINGADYVNIETRIFRIDDSSTFNINNLIITKGKTISRSGGVDVAYNCYFIANNCEFNNNEGLSGGAVFVFGSFVAINCLFYQNKTIGNGGAVFAFGIFISINSFFVNNKTDHYSGAVEIDGNFFISINSTFIGNNAVRGGAIFLDATAIMYSQHNTIDKNQANGTNGGGGISIRNSINKLYSYNCIYTENEENGIVSEEGQIRGTILAGKNFIENGTTITRDSVFGNNEYENGFIMPTKFAKTADRLTAVDIEVPEGWDAEELLSYIHKDALGQERPDTGYVTYGAVEYKDVGINENSIGILVFPTMSNNDFNIIFDNPVTQKVTIELVDIEGKIISNIYDGMLSDGNHTYRINTTNLSSGTYFIKFTIRDKIKTRKIIVN
jgi:hypothetical protein